MKIKLEATGNAPSADRDLRDKIKTEVLENSEGVETLESYLGETNAVDIIRD